MLVTGSGPVGQVLAVSVSLDIDMQKFYNLPPILGPATRIHVMQKKVLL